MKKKLSLTLALLLLLTACSPSAGTTPTPDPEPSTPVSSTTYKAGTYTASLRGHNGDLSLSLTVDNTHITDVSVTEHTETRGIGDYAIDAITKAIMEGQTLQVDTLTGATVTSATVLAAAKDCLTQAGADIDALTSNGPISSPEDKEYTCDVVVAGAGAAGLSAAYEAALAGAKVIVVEKQSIPGGSTARSGGSIQAAGTKLQASLNVEDTPEAFAQFLIERGEGHVNEEKLMLLAQKSSSTIDWLESLGVTFAPELQSLHRSIKPDRGHSAKEHAGIASGAGGELTDILYQACQKEGVTFLFDTPACSLIQDDKTITGVTCQKKDGSTVTVTAKAVVLATGGFDKNPELVAEYAPVSADALSSVPNGNVGDGLIMARDVGAKIVAGGGAVVLYMDLTTFSGESGGLFVLPDGSRFMDESSFWFVRTKALMDLGQNKMFFITDTSTDKNGNYADLAKNGKIFTADSPEALAQQLDMDPSVLSATVQRYNDLCAKGVDEDFGKEAEFLKSVDTQQIYAIPFKNNSSGTFGGPVTDLDGRVLDAEDQVITGLYAAGEVANGDLLWQEYPGSGTSLSIDFTFGRIAGQTAAADALS